MADSVEWRPILGVPVLRPTEPLQQLVDSVRGEARLLVIDNSEGAIDWDAYQLPEDAWVTQPFRNLGCAGSWNEIARSALVAGDPYVLIANADTVLAPGAIEYVRAELERPGPRWVGIDGDWRLMGVNAECVETVGWWDAGFYPIYNEDCDYEHRCTVAGVEWHNNQPTGSTHGSGLSWKTTEGGPRENTRTHQANNQRYRQKWGGGVRGGEAHRFPWDGDRADLCGPRLSHLRGQRWSV